MHRFKPDFCTWGAFCLSDSTNDDQIQLFLQTRQQEIQIQDNSWTLEM